MLRIEQWDESNNYRTLKHSREVFHKALRAVLDGETRFHVTGAPKDYDLVYLYLANNSPEDTWKSIIKEYDVLGDNVVHYNLPQDQQQAIEHFIGVTGYPTYKLIDREGNVLDVNADPRYNIGALTRLLDKMK